jgi:hypothetical protein
MTAPGHAVGDDGGQQRLDGAQQANMMASGSTA